MQVVVLFPLPCEDPFLARRTISQAFDSFRMGSSIRSDDDSRLRLENVHYNSWSKVVADGGK